MKTAKQVLLSALAVIVFAATSHAQPPVTGVYYSTPPLGTDVLDGRQSESWSAPTGFLSVGNTLYAQSWNGATLGTQWSISCPDVQALPVLIVDLVNPVTGNGQKIWSVSLSVPQTFTLDGAGAWAGGDAVYNGVITTASLTVTEQFVAFARTGAVANIAYSGHFVGPRYPCLQWAANWAEVGTTDGGAKPPGYPTFLTAGTCAAAGPPSLGQWGNHHQITMTIFDCMVPVEEKTWGAIKELYKN